MVIFLTVLVYGVNFLVYMYLKINHIKDYVEKIAIYFGTNMTLLFTSSIFLFFGKIVEDGILVFETAMINHGGRNGEVEAPNGSMHMKITPPGIHAEGTNPEQLFAAGYASCFNGAVQHMIKEAGMTAESTVKARVSLYNLDDGGYQIGVVLEVHIDGISEEEAQKIAEDAHEFCPYSKATRGNIDVEVTIV